MIQSTESSNRIEGITVSPRRLESIMKEKSPPKDRSEAEIAGYRDVLRTVHESHSYILIRSNTIQQLHRDLMAYVGANRGGKWKTAELTTSPLTANSEIPVSLDPLPRQLGFVCEGRCSVVCCRFRSSPALTPAHSAKCSPS